MTIERRVFPQCVAGRRSAIVGRALLFGTVLFVSGWGTARGQEQAPPAAVSDDATKDAQANGTDGEPAVAPAVPVGSADDEQARRRAFSTGVVMLGGILICGVGLIAIVLLWGNRVRRIARQSLPKVAPRDELWYLKHKVESDSDRTHERNQDDDSSAEPRA